MASKLNSIKDECYRPITGKIDQNNNMREIFLSKSCPSEYHSRIQTSEEYRQRKDIVENQVNTIQLRFRELYKLKEISDLALDEENSKVVEQLEQFRQKINREINGHIQRINEKCHTAVNLFKRKSTINWKFRKDGWKEKIEESLNEISELKQHAFSEEQARKLEVMEKELQKELSMMNVLSDIMKHENENNRIRFSSNFEKNFNEVSSVLKNLSVEVILHKNECINVEPVIYHRQSIYNIHEKQFTEKRVVDLRHTAKELRDCAILNDGRIIFTDYGQNRLILYSKTGNSFNIIYLKGNPFSITAIKERTVGISYSDLKTVQIMNVDTEEISWDFHFDMNCAGISYHNGKLVVRMEGYGFYVIDLESREKLHDIRIEGGTMPYVSHIDGRFLYANWKTGKVSCCLLNGKPLWEFKNEILINPNGITADSVGNVFVCGYGSNNVIAISRDGLVAKQVEPFIDTINAPLGIHYSKDSDELLITTKDGFATLYSVGSLKKTEIPRSLHER
ncbi:unnamed protein product [Mytilus coruscus]|uniref:TRIM2_3 n=1 Tax=Mytilus coruscus TaxID=42192 RepID=A0A6J8C7Q4_MYTCO|nr:unnamed protein product [Mytilus coruscus]